MKKFNVNLHPSNAPKIIEALCHPPITSWIKCNTDGSSNFNTSSCGGIFSNSDADFLLGFAENVGPENAYYAKLCGAMRAIDIAHQNNWSNLWLELDSALVVNAFKNKYVVPWKLRNRWNNCIIKTRRMNFIASHVFRDGNQCANILANFGLASNHLTMWLVVPNCIRVHYVQNKLGMSNFRFVNF